MTSKALAAVDGTGPSMAIRRYMADQISSAEYVEEVAQQAERELDRKLEEMERGSS